MEGRGNQQHRLYLSIDNKLPDRARLVVSAGDGLRCDENTGFRNPADQELFLRAFYELGIRLELRGPTTASSIVGQQNQRRTSFSIKLRCALCSFAVNIRATENDNNICMPKLRA